VDGRARPRAYVEPYPYVVRAPRGYAGGPLPVLLCLHGSGECGTDLKRLERHGPLREADAGRDLPFLIVAPQAREERWDPERISATLDAVFWNYDIDRHRIYATGYSLGADGVWAAALHEPRRYAAIATLCGGGDARKARRIVQLPIWNFHGDRDGIVRIAESEEMVNALRAAGAKHVRFTVYRGAGHDIWTRTYADPALYQWLLAQRRR
jgi:predicted peptidase